MVAFNVGVLIDLANLARRMCHPVGRRFKSQNFRQAAVLPKSQWVQVTPAPNKVGSFGAGVIKFMVNWGTAVRST
jgi:hypothetical protein